MYISCCNLVIQLKISYEVPGKMIANIANMLMNLISCAAVNASSGADVELSERRHTDVGPMTITIWLNVSQCHVIFMNMRS